MKAVFQRFEDNVREVESYFRFLATVLEPDAQLYRPNQRSRKYSAIDDGTQRMLKAAALLVLYNLTEATTSDALRAIHGAIERDRLTFDRARNEVQALWINFRTVHLTKGPVGIDKVRKAAREMVDDVLRQAHVTMDDDYPRLSGNVDASKVRELAERFGFSATVIGAARHGSSLTIVREKRNELAHGESSFSQCGGEFAPSQLESIKHEVIIYLRNILRNIQRYVDKKRFRAAAS